jgi:hypothetical protein
MIAECDPDGCDVGRCDERGFEALFATFAVFRLLARKDIERGGK